MQPPPEPSVQKNDRARKQADEPPPEQPEREKPTGRQVEQPLQANTKGKQSEQSRSQQSVQTDRKGKQVEQAAQPILISKQPQLTFQQWLQIKNNQQSLPRQTVHAKLKGKQTEQPRQPNPRLRSKSKQLQADSLDQSKHPTAKGQQSQNLSSEEWRQAKPPRRAILANAKPVYLGCPKVYITRIPYSRNGKPRSIHRVKVSVIPDVGRHPQTFLFKNIPDVEYYWGFLNDAATTAQRIVRLERDGQPTPYFLLACRGEWPKVTSPRNDNAIFAGVQEPTVFSDAFVFKLGEPEIYEDGYVRYVHIEEDLGNIDWIPEAIREAAKKVEYATPLDANPGFPDMENYADPETMSKDVQKMRKHMNAYRKAAEGYGSDLPTEYEPGMLEFGAMKETVAKMTVLLYKMREDVFGDFESSDHRMDQDCIQQANAAFKAIRDHDATQNVDDASSDSTTDANEINSRIHQEIEMVYFDLMQKVIYVHDMLYGDDKELGHRRALKEVYDAFGALKFKVDDAFRNVKVAQKVDAAWKNDTVETPGATSELPDLPGHPGTSRYRVERLD